MAPILIDKTGNYPIHLYIGKDGIPDNIDHELHMGILNERVSGWCNRISCLDCPLNTDSDEESCLSLSLYSNKYPKLLEDYPELFI